mgnify:CR=1 FL=1
MLSLLQVQNAITSAGASYKDEEVAHTSPFRHLGRARTIGVFQGPHPIGLVYLTSPTVTNMVTPEQKVRVAQGSKEVRSFNFF